MSMTLERLVRLRDLLRQIPVDTSMKDFDGRLRFQKTLYLLQELGVKLNYSYGWYIRGPYSREAAADGFALSAMAKVVSSYEFDQLVESEKTAIQKINRLIADVKRQFGSIEEGLEILASVDFVKRRMYPPATSEPEITSRLQEAGKPQMTHEQVDSAIKLLDKYGLS